MLKAYFTAATSYNGQLHELYKAILETLRKKGHKVLSGSQIINLQLRKKDKQLSSEEIFRREQKLIDEADYIVAEVSRPSLGVGSEIVYALKLGKPVLALVHVGFEDKISPIIAGNPSEKLFFQYYQANNLSLVINNFLKYINALSLNAKPKGKLIVIDGGDGSGKTTQTELLVKYLKQKGVPTKFYDFPQYYNSFHGATVARFLRGEFGEFDKVSPYFASLAYALDRASVRKEMENFLKRGGYIIANRYATSNMAHQAAKFKEKKEREKFLTWEYELEYKVHKIPKEDLVIFLYVPWRIGFELTKHKTGRGYLKGKGLDIAEKNLAHRKATEKMYLELAKKNKHWVKIDCVKDGKLLSREAIHQKILAIVNKLMF